MGLYQKGENWFIDYYAYGKRKREKIGTCKETAKYVLRKRKNDIADHKFRERYKKRRKDLSIATCRQITRNGRLTFWRPKWTLFGHQRCLAVYHLKKLILQVKWCWPVEKFAPVAQMDRAQVS